MVQVNWTVPINCELGENTKFLFFSSDWHIDDHDFDRKRFQAQHDEAVECNAQGIFYGDMWSLMLLRTDRRATKGNNAEYKTEDELDEALERAEELFAPYVNVYDVLGCGNHEVTAQEMYHRDMIRHMVRFANKNRDHEKRPQPVIHGGYCGLCRYQFKRPTHSRAYDVFWDHGQGGGAEISRGEIMLSRYAMWVCADLMAFGHIHEHVIRGIPQQAYLNNAGRLCWRKRKAIITSPYRKDPEPHDYEQTGYEKDWATEKFRVPKQAEGGILVRLDINWAKGELRARAMESA